VHGRNTLYNFLGNHLKWEELQGTRAVHLFHWMGSFRCQGDAPCAHFVLNSTSLQLIPAYSAKVGVSRKPLLELA
jgi:hypothetical protein